MLSLLALQRKPKNQNQNANAFKIVKEKMVVALAKCNIRKFKYALSEFMIQPNFYCNLIIGIKFRAFRCVMVGLFI